MNKEELKNKLIRKYYSFHDYINDDDFNYILNNKFNVPSFDIKLDSIITNRTFTAAEFLDLYMPIINILCPDSPSDWLLYIYNYALSKSFPESATIRLDSSLNTVCELFLKSFRIICSYEKSCGNTNKFYVRFPLELLSKTEIDELENKEEYNTFTRAFSQNYVYELMKINGEIFKFNTLDHICGVHYLAMFIARQLKIKGINIDLGRVSGAAAGHDLGKYGCRGDEMHLVPHLHYYYSDEWFKKFNINYIRNIAINHSVWDLELENLSLESLILIYCDFRVKNIIIDGKDQMHFYSLNDSFNVILSKLENVDNKKAARYKKVYGKLSDFEAYLISLNVNTDPYGSLDCSPVSQPIYELQNGDELVKSLKTLAITHNTSIMYLLRDEYSLNRILDQANSEDNPENLRQYLQVLNEYSTYFTQRQKLQTINFLFDKVTHEEDDIRKTSASLMGRLIAIFDEDYRKDLPKDVKIPVPKTTSFTLLDKYLSMMLHASPNYIPAHRKWLGYNIKALISSLFNNIDKKNIEEYRMIILKHYSDYKNTAYEIKLFLLDASKYIPLEDDRGELTKLISFLLEAIKSHHLDVRLSALESLYHVIKESSARTDNISLIKNTLVNYVSCTPKTPTENYLYKQIFLKLGIVKMQQAFTNFCTSDYEKVTEIFLSNLKAATNWYIKKIQINILLDYTVNAESASALQTCIHYCNLLRVSEYESVRNLSGNGILKLMPILTSSERNEVAIELLRSLEMEGQKFTQYIPPFLGKILFWLKPAELDEIITDLQGKVKTSKEEVKILLLRTAGIFIGNYNLYKTQFKEADNVIIARLEKLLSILFNGLGDYSLAVKEAASIIIGNDLFGNPGLDSEIKVNIFKLCCKKLLTTVGNASKKQLLLLSNASMLNHIYRFISDYTFDKNLNIKIPDKVAFFPGTFDPFSLSHKYIATTIRDMGYEVYLAIDEFSWSKKTLPNLLRKTLANLSICDEFNIYIYPESIQINIANEEDLKSLRETFKDSKVYFVAGSDVIENASCYKKLPSTDSIHSFPHIIFKRGKLNKSAIKGLINNDVVVLNIPPRYSVISSTKIRKYIDKSRDISTLVDPLVAKYIFANGFYQREPINKLEPDTITLSFVSFKNPGSETLKDILKHIDSMDVNEALSALLPKENSFLIEISDITSKKVLALAVMHAVKADELYREIKNEGDCITIRMKALSPLIVIDYIYVQSYEGSREMEQIIITEALSYAVKEDFQYALFKPVETMPVSSFLLDTLSCQGFVKITDEADSLLIVNMTNPCILNLDVTNLLKEPFRSNRHVQSIIHERRRELQKALINLYPGNLLLSFNINVLHQRMINNICRENNVRNVVEVPRSLGDAMCVPYGDILDRYIVPNTVTKSLHTEKYFNGSITDFFIGQSPYYLSLKNQINMIKSFSRPIILVDNILHKGFRIRALDPLLNKNNIAVKKILCGILSGRGKDLMDRQNREVSSVYFIPRMRVWFNESSEYPFIGGDGVWRGDFPKRNLLPSINPILPYSYPVFIKDATRNSVYNLSKVCLENSIEILKVLETEFHREYDKNLTLSSLGEVFTIPRCPDIGKDISYDLLTAPSRLLERDLEQLTRLSNIL